MNVYWGRFLLRSNPYCLPTCGVVVWQPIAGAWASRVADCRSPVFPSAKAGTRYKLDSEVKHLQFLFPQPLTSFFFSFRDSCRVKMAAFFSRLPSIPYPPEQDGFFSPVTSTLDWCEEVS